MEIRERLWILMGIIVGFYGNWYFNLITQLELIEDLTIQFVWIISLASLLFYFIEVTHWKKTSWRNRVRLGFILETIHFFSTGYLYFAASLSIYQFSGLILWMAVMTTEQKLFFMTEG